MMFFHCTRLWAFFLRSCQLVLILLISSSVSLLQLFLGLPLFLLPCGFQLLVADFVPPPNLEDSSETGVDEGRHPEAAGELFEHQAVISDGILGYIQRERKLNVALDYMTPAANGERALKLLPTFLLHFIETEEKCADRRLKSHREPLLKLSLLGPIWLNTSVRPACHFHTFCAWEMTPQHPRPSPSSLGMPWSRSPCWGQLCASRLFMFST